MPNKAPHRVAVSKARLLRSAQASESRMARSSSRRGAGNRRHSSSCIAMSDPSRFWISIARSGESSTMAPSMCERNVTPLSATLRNCESDMTWKPPESVRIGCGQFMNVCRPPSAATRSAPGAQHQMVGVGEHDVGAGRAHRFGREPFDRRLGADRHENRGCDKPVRGRELTAAGVAVRRQQAEGKGVRRRRGRCGGTGLRHHDLGSGPDIFAAQPSPRGFPR